ncbi:MAG: HU family DNA-binding protein [Prevotella sp.]|nr:HU family DNA-binding protein [Prevotella sp.]
MATKATTKKAALPKAVQTTPTSIDQMSIAKKVAGRLGLKLTDVMLVIEEEQKLTMEYVKMGCKVIKKNYLTIEGKKVEGKKDWISPLTGKKYTIDPSVRVYVRVGRGFKQYIAEKKMPDRLCRFVSGGVELGLKVQEKSS